MAHSHLPNKTEKRDLTAISADIKKDFIALKTIIAGITKRLLEQERSRFSFGNKNKREKIEAALARLEIAINDPSKNLQSISDLLNYKQDKINTDKQEQEMSLQEALNINRLLINKKETRSAKEVREQLESLPETKPTNLLSLPDDILRLILANTGYHGVTQASRVNKRLNSVVASLSKKNEPENDSYFWRAETATHFPNHLVRQTIFKSQKPVKDKDFFVAAHKKDYASFIKQDANKPNPKQIKWRRLIKENNLAALQLETITLDDLLVLDSAHTDLIGYAARNNNQAILNHFYKIAENKKKQKPELLFWAVRCNQIEEVKNILDDLPGCINKTTFDYNKGLEYSLLCLAARYGYLDMARVLIGKGAELNQLDPMQPTPIHAACIFGQFKMVKMLVDDFKVEPRFIFSFTSIESPSHTALDVACQFGHANIAKYLLEKTLVKDIKNRRKFSAPALISACMYDHIDVVKTLLTTQVYKIDALQEAYQCAQEPIIKYWLLKIMLILKIRELTQTLAARKNPARSGLDIFTFDSSTQIDPAQKLLDALNQRKSIKDLDSAELKNSFFNQFKNNRIAYIYEELLKLDLDEIWEELGDAPYDGLSKYYADSSTENKNNNDDVAPAAAIEAPKKA